MIAGLDLNLVFAGTPDFSAHYLERLVANNIHFLSVWTQPDRPGKRGRQPQPSPVKEIALKHALPVFQPQRIDNRAIEQLAELNPDLMLVIAYGQLLPEELLRIPKFGCINVHTSLLPRWRGAAPVQRAIEAGDAASGVTIMQMDKGLDTGDILGTSECSIEPDETAGSLLHKLEDSGQELLLRTLDSISRGQLNPRPQELQGVTYAHKVSKLEAEIDWHRPATQLDRQIRMLNPSPVAFTFMGTMRIRIWFACVAEGRRQGHPGEIIELNSDGLYVSCGEGVLQISKLQIPLGKGRVISAVDLCNSRKDLFKPGCQLGSTSAG